MLCVLPKKHSSIVQQATYAPMKLLNVLTLVPVVEGFMRRPPHSFHKSTSQLPYIEGDQTDNVLILKEPQLKTTSWQAPTPEKQSLWPNEGPYSRAVDCTVDEEIECDIDEISRLASQLSDVEDDECTLEVQTGDDCTEEISGRNNLQKALNARRELHDLQEDLKNSKFVDMVQEEKGKAWKDHWYNEYLEFYYQ